MGFKLEHTISENRPNPARDRVTNLLQKEITLFGKTFGNKKKEDFYTELAVLLKAGINLKDALALIHENQKKEKLKLFYGGMVEDLVSGQSFFEVLHKRKEFSEYEYYSIRIGEETGTLARITAELGTFYQRKNEQRRGLMNALTYPVIILVTAILVVIFMLRMVVPMFEDIFKQNNVDLPGITKMIIAASDFIGKYGGLLVLLLASFLLPGQNVFPKKMV